VTGEADLLARAKARLDTLPLYPEPVDVSGVSIHVVPWLFRVPGFRRFRGYATFRRILLRGPGLDEDLIVHELCHVWQAQHRPVRMWLSYVRPSTFTRDRRAYRANPYEREARAAVQATRALVSRPRPTGSEPVMPATLEVPGPVVPDQPMPNPPGAPETPDPPAPEVPGVDPKGPEIPDSPPSPEPQTPAERV
jgi:hypothetical protein